MHRRLRPRRDTPSAVRACGIVRHAETVDVVLYGAEPGEARRAGLVGIQRCGLLWQCPSCEAASLAERRAVVKGVVGRAYAAGWGTYLLTLTVRHREDHDGRETRAVLERAWRLATKGREYDEHARLYTPPDMAGATMEHVRRIEVLYGQNGAHVHMHVLMLTPRALTLREQAVEDDWWADRWQAAVAQAQRELGAEGRQPNYANGTDYTHVDAVVGGYITKLGLEVALQEKNGVGRTHLGILNEWSETGSERAWAQWREHCETMKGARALTWSRGLRWWRQEVETELEERAERLGAEEVGVLLALEWDVLARMPGMSAEVYICEAAERGGAAEVGSILRWLAVEVAARANQDRGPPPDVGWGVPERRG